MEFTDTKRRNSNIWNGGAIMSAEFHPNGSIEELIEKYGPNAAEVKQAIEFWGPDAGEFVRNDEPDAEESFLPTPAHPMV